MPISAESGVSQPAHRMPTARILHRKPTSPLPNEQSSPSELMLAAAGDVCPAVTYAGHRSRRQVTLFSALHERDKGKSNSYRQPGCFVFSFSSDATMQGVGGYSRRGQTRSGGFVGSAVYLQMQVMHQAHQACLNAGTVGFVTGDCRAGNGARRIHRRVMV